MSVLVGGTLVIGSVATAGPAFADSSTTTPASAADAVVETEAVSSDTVRFTSDTHRFAANSNGEMTAVEIPSRAIEELPSLATDRDGNSVSLAYKVQEDGSVLVTSVLTDTIRHSTVSLRSGIGSDAKCWLGIVGAGAGGALAGAAAGSVVPGLGTIGGAIAGGIAGNAAGTAAAC
ncbi:hypothetical protein [Pseudoclavibacter sp. VKM Ac-2867]|uniref:hypothetical protein n=1 Tax=Pseudoclavibacter sp. VKM Ac-2867 TaxID=2783829 RepID=UPI00188A90BD|nr:hypothetical protein [Pseudoclavibacter sp. VKM Ac-2867]MBF4460515.1 hypothetical protein [Pseudoclavibacter sp. VKM Ac-2867]